MHARKAPPAAGVCIWTAGSGPTAAACRADLTAA